MIKPLVMIILCLFLVACQTQQVVCPEPYMRLGTGCCLDKDGNNICDEDEIKIENSSVEEEIEFINEDIVVKNSTNIENETQSAEDIRFNSIEPVGVRNNNIFFELTDMEIVEVDYDWLEIRSMLINIENHRSNDVEIHPDIEVFVYEKENFLNPASPLKIIESGYVSANGESYYGWDEVNIPIRKPEISKFIKLKLYDVSTYPNKYIGTVKTQIDFAEFVKEYPYTDLDTCNEIKDDAIKHKCIGIISGRMQSKSNCDSLDGSASRIDIKNHAWCIYGYVVETGDKSYCQKTKYQYGEEIHRIKDQCDKL